MQKPTVEETGNSEMKIFRAQIKGNVFLGYFTDKKYETWKIFHGKITELVTL